MQRNLFTFLLTLSLLVSTSLLKAQGQDERDGYLQTYGQVWGFLKYFNPSALPDPVAWDQQLRKDYSTIQTLSSPADFETFLEQFIRPYIPKDIRYTRPSALPGMTLPSFGWINEDRISPGIRKELLLILKHGKAKPHPSFSVSDGLVPVFDAEKSDPIDSLPNEAGRYLALTRFWNVINYFAPNLDLCDRWDEAYPHFIPAFRHVNSYRSYCMQVQKLASRMNDGHGYVNLLPGNKNQVAPPYRLPLGLEYIEGQTYIVSVIDTVKGKLSVLHPGDRILSINDRPMEALWDSLLPVISGSNALYKRELGCKLKLIKSWYANNTLVVLRGTDTIRTQVTASLPVSHPSWAQTDPIKTSWRIIHDSVSGNDIGYVNMGALKRKEVKIAFHAFRKAPFVMIDCRDYPNSTIYKVMNQLTLRGGAFMKFNRIRFDDPGTMDWQLSSKPRGLMMKLIVRLIIGKPDKKNRHYYKGKVILLVDHFTMSQGEFSVMAFQLAPQVITIGRQTAGADGNAVPVPLPGGLTVSYSSLGVFYPDGTRTQQQGIRLDIRVPETRVSLIGKDDIYLRALEYMRTGR